MTDAGFLYEAKLAGKSIESGNEAVSVRFTAHNYHGRPGSL